jgi:hypothetical protein
MNMRALKLCDRDFGDQWANEVESRWDYPDFINNEGWRKDWISFDGVVHHAASDRVLCGITSFDADIFKAYDCKSRQFVDLGFDKVADRYDAKFHRSMQLTEDGGTLYAATALLHDIDRYHDAPGGGLFAFDTASGSITKLGVPLPHIYIQSIALDEKRGVIYCMHFTPERLSRFDLSTHTARDLGPIGPGMFMAQGENIILDDDGCAWCGWGMTRAWQGHWGPDAFRLCKYDPDKDRIDYVNKGLPRRDGQYGYAKVEGLFNLGAHCLHASGDNGSLYRIDTATGEAKYLGTPIADRASRLTNLVLHSDGFAYGVTGREGNCCVIKFDPNRDTWELGDAVIDGDEPMWQCHDVAITPDGTLYAGENDHPRRSGYLWQIEGVAK